MTGDHGSHRPADIIPATPYDRPVIFITAKFRVLSEHADRWGDITREFTEATRAEPGNLWFDWSRSLDDPTEYVLVEAFRDGDAGAAHVQSDHFATADGDAPRLPGRDAPDRQSDRRSGRLVRARRDEGRLTDRLGEVLELGGECAAGRIAPNRAAESGGTRTERRIVEHSSDGGGDRRR